MAGLRATTCLIAMAIMAAMGTTTTTPSRMKMDRSVQGRAFEQQLRALLEDFRELMINGGGDNSTFPVLDPFFKETASITINIPHTAEFTLDMQNLTITELASFVVDHVNFNVLSLRFDYAFTFPWVNITAEHYDVYGDVMGSQLTGSGKVHASAKSTEMWGHAKLAIREGHLYMTEFDISLEIDTFTSEAEGLLDGGDQGILLNKILEQVVPGTLITFRQQISDTIATIVMDLVNPFLSEMTLQDLIDWITGGNGSKIYSS